MSTTVSDSSHGKLVKKEKKPWKKAWDKLNAKEDQKTTNPEAEENSQSNPPQDGGNGPVTTIKRAPTEPTPPQSAAILTPYEKSKREREEMEKKTREMKQKTLEQHNGTGQLEVDSSNESLPTPLPKDKTPTETASDPVGTPSSSAVSRKPLRSMLDISDPPHPPASQSSLPSTNGRPQYRDRLGSSNDISKWPTDPFGDDSRLELQRSQTENHATRWYQQELEEKTRLNQEFRNQIVALETQLREHENAIQRANASASDYAQTLSEKDSLISRLKNDYQAIRSSRDKEFEKVAQLSQRNKELEEDFHQGQINYTRLNKEHMQLKAELSNELDDEWFTSRWDQLHARIQNLTMDFFNGKMAGRRGAMVSRGKGARPEEIDSHSPRLLMELTRDFEPYINSDTHRPLLIQAFIWWMINFKVFDHGSRYSDGLLWAGIMREPLSVLKGKLRPSQRTEGPQSTPAELERQEAEAREFHRWRATTAIMLLSNQHPKKNTEDPDVEKLINLVTRTVSPYMARKEMDRPKAEEEFGNRLDRIIMDAVSLDAGIYQQRAWIFSDQWSHKVKHEVFLYGFDLEDEFMDPIFGPDRPKGGEAYHRPLVELVIQPPLYKTGNSLGQNYAKTQLLRKAKVVVGESPTYQSTRGHAKRAWI